MSTPKLHIDKELSRFLPELTKEERSDLRQSLMEDGCTDPVIYWKETGAIVDGNNRFDICNHEGLGFPSKEKSFETQLDAKRWILKRQFGRRNLPPMARVTLVQQVEHEHLRLEAEARMKAGKSPNAPAVRTNKQIAEIADVSETTVKQVNKINTSAIPEVVEAATAGEISTNKASKIADIPKDKQPKALQDAKAKKPPPKKNTGLDKGKLVRQMKGLMSQVVSCLDARGKDGNYTKCNDALNDFLRAWEDWK